MTKKDFTGKTGICKVRFQTDPIFHHKIKVFRQQIEIEICSNLPTAFWHRHQHIVQSSCEKDSNRKDTKERTMLTISFSQYEWTDSLTKYTKQDCNK